MMSRLARIVLVNNKWEMGSWLWHRPALCKPCITFEFVYFQRHRDILPVPRWLWPANTAATSSAPRREVPLPRQPRLQRPILAAPRVLRVLTSTGESTAWCESLEQGNFLKLKFTQWYRLLCEVPSGWEHLVQALMSHFSLPIPPSHPLPFTPRWPIPHPHSKPPWPIPLCGQSPPPTTNFLCG